MIYIQSDTNRTMAHHFDAACALYGAIDTGLEYRLTSFEEVQSGKFDALIKQNLFVGSVEFMREVFRRINKTDVRLPMNSDRPCKILTLKQVKERVAEGEKLFIKPREIKLFTGFVIDSMATYSSIKNLPEDTEVMTFEPFHCKISSEWRLYIHNRQIVDARNYSGGFEISPSFGYWESVLDLGIKKPDLVSVPFKDFPCAYTMDVAILQDETDAVVEFNDFWAIGNYGIENALYLRMLRDRYFEIVKN